MSPTSQSPLDFNPYRFRILIRQLLYTGALGPGSMVLADDSAVITLTMNGRGQVSRNLVKLFSRTHTVPGKLHGQAFLVNK